MATLRDFLIKEELALDGFRVLHVDDINAYGTSEGAARGWDSRGRGKKTLPRPAGTLYKNAPKPGTKLSKKVSGWANNAYENLKLDEKAVDKIDNKGSLRGIVLKHAWFAKRLGDLMQSWEGFKDFTDTTYKVVERLAKFLLGVGGAHEVGVALHHAVVALAPVIKHLAQATGSLTFGGTSEGAEKGWDGRARTRRSEDSKDIVPPIYKKKGPEGEERRAWGYPRRREDKPVMTFTKGPGKCPRCGSMNTVAMGAHTVKCKSCGNLGVRQ